MIVEILQTQPRLGLRKGQRFQAEPYWVDPSKVTLKNRITRSGRVLKRTGDCNQYRNEIKIEE